jgi:class 3 adenylate cyclase
MYIAPAMSMNASAQKRSEGREAYPAPSTGPGEESLVRCDWLGGVDIDPSASMIAGRRSFVTVLFTDIVDSTRHALEMGDHQWLALQEDHGRMSAAAVDRFRGQVLRSTGDGMLATFTSAIAGALCAARIVESSPSFGIHLRAGIHAGECEGRGRRMGGLVFHIGARIVDLAGPDQILVSQTIPDLTVGSGLEFQPYGRHVLKGLRQEWTVYELRSREADLRKQDQTPGGSGGSLPA